MRGKPQSSVRRGAQQRQGLGIGTPLRIRGRGNRVWRGGLPYGNVQLNNDHTGGSATASTPKNNASTNPPVWQRTSGGNISLTRGGANRNRPYNMTWKGNTGSRGRRGREMIAQDEEMQQYEDTGEMQQYEDTGGMKELPDPNVHEEAVIKFLEKFFREYNHTCARCRAADFFYSYPVPLQSDRKIIFESEEEQETPSISPIFNDSFNNNNNNSPAQHSPFPIPSSLNQQIPNFFQSHLSKLETPSTFIPSPNLFSSQKDPATLQNTPQDSPIVTKAPQKKPVKTVSFVFHEDKGKRCLPVDSESASKKKVCLSSESVDENVKVRKRSFDDESDSKKENKDKGKEVEVPAESIQPTKKKVQKIQTKPKKQSRPWQEINVDYEWINSNFKLRGSFCNWDESKCMNPNCNTHQIQQPFWLTKMFKEGPKKFIF
ncbi:1756_t:CDS:2 [Ambispora leptoticha]|uniref:1756_t:CDS:1 n=1 Tax=Ambispora leptoticha TaxID=144679 RepID=A0A9N8YNR4_9GLOM|nr:1756_t:CDS:2 [Ambispora leptoticha]